jgi:hypothetical protein
LSRHNRRASDDNKRILPIGIGVGKLFKFGKLPVLFK